MAPNRSNTRTLILTLIGAVGLGTPAAMAQNALGDGRALDANSGSGGRVNYERPSFAQELQFRNAVVTGNAPGGLSFRGDLGYRAAGEFTGELGSDGLFAFRRDSLYSGLAGMGIRGTDALQYQFSLTTGARPPQNLIGNLSYSREPSAANAPVARDPNAVDIRGLNLYQPSNQETDLIDALSGSMRSSSTYTANTALSPVILSTFERGIERTPYGLTASALTGITATPLSSPADIAANRTTGGMPRDPLGERSATAYDQVLTMIRERAEARAAQTNNPASGEASAVMNELGAVRNALMGIPTPENATTDPNAAADPADPADPNAQPAVTPGTVTPGVQTPGVQTPGATPTDPNATPDRTSGADPTNAYDPARYRMDPGTLDLIRASERPVEALIDPNATSRDIFSEHMRAGERLIATERYFEAEERFARALAVRPSDQTAQLGRVHAQLGAGLLLSGAVNLRTLFTLHPEMIGTRYSGRLLPAPDRIDTLIINLRERAGLLPVEGRPLEDVSIRRAAALMLAYLGFQNQNRAVIKEGLDALQDFGAVDDRVLADVLRQIWLPDEPTTTTPTPATDGDGT